MVDGLPDGGASALFASATEEARPSDRKPAPSWFLPLYSENCRLLARYLQRKYGSGPPEPDDIAHEAFARLADLSEHDYGAIENPKGFLFRMAENLLISAKRKSRIVATHAADENYREHAHSDLTPERVLAAKDELDLVERTIRAMPDTRRKCFLMHRYDELSYTEISRRCGITPNGVKGHVERALRDIAKALDAAELGQPFPDVRKP